MVSSLCRYRRGILAVTVEREPGLAIFREAARENHSREISRISVKLLKDPEDFPLPLVHLVEHLLFD